MIPAAPLDLRCLEIGRAAGSRIAVLYWMQAGGAGAAGWWRWLSVIITKARRTACRAALHFDPPRAFTLSSLKYEGPSSWPTVCNSQQWHAYACHRCVSIYKRQAFVSRADFMGHSRRPWLLVREHRRRARQRKAVDLVRAAGRLPASGHRPWLRHRACRWASGQGVWDPTGGHFRNHEVDVR